MSTGGSYDVPASAPLDNMTASTEGAAKALAAALVARDSTASGSGYIFPAARAQAISSGEEWKTEWTQGDAAMAAWKAANTSSAGASWIWFQAVADVGAAVGAWHTKWGADENQLTVGNGAFAETLVKETGGSGDDGLCDTAAQATGSWGTNPDAQAATSIAECKTACEATAVAALVVDVDTSAGSGGATTTASNGGASMGVYASDSSSAWCGGYTWDDDNATAADKCKLLLGSDDPRVPTASSTSDRCAKMTTVKAFADASKTIYDAWVLVTAGMHTNLVNQVEA